MQCPKCNSLAISVRYMPDNDYCGWPKRVNSNTRPHAPCLDVKGEHFEYYCQNCKYEWSVEVSDDRYYLDLKGAHERLCRLETTVDEKYKWLIDIALKIVGWLLDNTTDARNSYGPNNCNIEELLERQRHD